MNGQRTLFIPDGTPQSEYCEHAIDCYNRLCNESRGTITFCMEYKQPSEQDDRFLLTIADYFKDGTIEITRYTHYRGSRYFTTYFVTIDVEGMQAVLDAIRAYTAHDKNKQTK